MFEPEEFLETLERMISLNMDLLEAINGAEDAKALGMEDSDLADAKVKGCDVVMEDLKRLRDLSRRIRLQFGLDKYVIN